MSYKIYFVDDDKFLLDLYAVKFKNAGNEVKVFSDAEGLISELKNDETPPDAILIDIIMPGMTGFEIIELIHKENLASGSKIIVLSNQGQDSDIEKAKGLSVDGYIIKAEAVPSEVLEKTIQIIEKNTNSN